MCNKRKGEGNDRAEKNGKYKSGCAESNCTFLGTFSCLWVPEWSSTSSVFSSFISNSASASISLIICPSNWNLICLRDKPCHSHQVFICPRALDSSSSTELPPDLLQLNLPTVPVLTLPGGFHQPHECLRPLSCCITKEEPGLHPTHQLHRRVGGDGTVVMLSGGILCSTSVPAWRHPEAVSFVSDLEKLSFPARLFWLLEDPGLGPCPLLFSPRGLTGSHQPHPSYSRLSALAPGFHTGSSTVQRPQRRQPFKNMNQRAEGKMAEK